MLTRVVYAESHTQGNSQQFLEKLNYIHKDKKIAEQKLRKHRKATKHETKIYRKEAARIIRKLKREIELETSEHLKKQLSILIGIDNSAR